MISLSSYNEKGKPFPGSGPTIVPAEWNYTKYPHSLDLCIHELFEEQVSRTPEAIAVFSEEGRLTFRDLNERANRLARVLRHRGAGPNTFVGISLDRSLEMMVGIYGVLKAGAAYVPLDPLYPPDRLSYMLQAAQIRILLTQNRLVGLFDGLPALDILRLDAEWPTISQESKDNLGPLAAPDNFIYLIFTSGSTGKPKGAAVYHRGFTNLLLWFVTEFGITDRDRNLLVSSFSFDLTQKNLYAPLIKGGMLRLAPTGPYDAQKLSHVIHDHGITLINCTPSAFYPIMETSGAGQFSRLESLRFAFLGGEPISIPRLRPWMTSPTCRAEVANTYGPTECTDICGSYLLKRTNLDDYDFVPLGRPIHNVQLVIVDEALNVCPIGEAGELCVAGAGIGAGYINDPEKTAAKFIPNPFPEIGGASIYRTGDQARWLPQGVIEFLGRLDHQVKIRGFRIELHEIESVLKAHPNVREAVVVVRGDPGNDAAQLIGYVTVKEGVAVEAVEFRKYLIDRLPAYMVPVRFHVIPEFPLSPNGKVDRKALEIRQKSESYPVIKGTTELPLNELEGRIREIWLEVLEIEHVGLNENFFDVGGNSIQLAKVHARLQALFQQEFSITDLFVETTIRGLARYLGKTTIPVLEANAIQDRAQRQKAALAARRLARR
jgi:amino acid adenylation domain-containing protein